MIAQNMEVKGKSAQGIGMNRSSKKIKKKKFNKKKTILDQSGAAIANKNKSQPIDGEDSFSEGKNETMRDKKKLKNKTANVRPNFIKPKSQVDISSNWKNLLKTMPKEEPKPKPGLEHRFRKPVHKPQPKKIEKPAVHKSDIWFDDVDQMLLDPEDRPNSNSSEDAGGKTTVLVKEKSFAGLTKVIGMDCEMVGVGPGGTDSILARVSLVNHFGHPVYDKFVANREAVTDYRTHVSGIRPQDLVGAPDFTTVQKEVSDLLKGRILVGHALKHDTKVLFLDHPKRHIRDTALYKPFRAAFGGRTPSLKNLSARMLGVAVQTGEHSSVQDAQAAMRLYTMFRKEWEAELVAKKGKQSKKSDKKTSASKSSHSSLLGDEVAGLQGTLQAVPREYEDSDSD